jgi:alpha-tubulin suppressor-like RCC1 family protein
VDRHSLFVASAVRHAAVPLAMAATAVSLAACRGEPAAPVPPQFRSVSAGYLHTCAVTTSGATFCWGENRLGALGDGQRDTNSLVPVPVGGHLSFAAVSAGGEDSGHTCGLTPGGVGYCWGNATFGRLGDGVNGIGGAVAPRAVAGTLRFAGMSAGYDNSCGLLAGGALWCWGDGSFGQLGNGAFSTYSLSPVSVSGGLTFVAVSAGAQHGCGIAAGGAAYCWGYNGLGALGNGTSRDTALPAVVSGGFVFVAISSGRNHTCAVTVDSAAYCWGYNDFGRLGDGSTTASTVPVAVAGGLHFAMIGAGGYHSCGLTSGGQAYCWGRNESGQLGDGTTTNRLLPVAVGSGLSFAAVTTGWRHTCGVTTAGAVYCWGLNDHGQLGDGTTSSRSAPRRISGPAL